LSLKENVEFVKEELNSEEKFFEKAVVTERFLKKYKNIIIGGAVALVVVAFGNVAYDMKEQSRIKTANEQLSILLQNPSDVKAQENLKTASKKLYQLWSFSNSVKNNDTKKLDELSKTKLPVISDISNYLMAVNEQNIQKLDDYTLRQDAIFKDFANIQSGIIYMNKKEISKADAKFASIKEDSPLGSVASMLKHYGIK